MFFYFIVLLLLKGKAIINMKKLVYILILLISIPLDALSATSTQVKSVRLWTAPDHTRLVFDVSKSLEHKLFLLHNPERLVIDLKSSVFKATFKPKDMVNKHVSGLRHGLRKNGGLRIVMDLASKVSPKSFLLKPNKSYGNRLVVDLYDNKDKGKKAFKKSMTSLKKNRDVVIAIDAGHGGEDPGALGAKRSSKEKYITLAIAKKLKKMIDKEPGMKAVLTRKGDYYVGLRKRMKIARNNHADLFVSLHADAFKDKRAKGASVYVLSRRGASSEAARWLAEKENSADLVGGVSLDDKDHILASVLLDLSQSASQYVSLAAAHKIHKELKKVGKIHGKGIHKAGFMVLKSPDVPSMLVELGYISNPAEERKLTQREGQTKMAKAVFKGVKSYFVSAPPPGTYLASRTTSSNRSHTIRRGDTLSVIAMRYDVRLANLRKSNRLKTDRLLIGQVLKIPKT